VPVARLGRSGRRGDGNGDALQRGQRKNAPVAGVDRVAADAGGTSMNEFERHPWIGDARTLLDESAQRLDAATLSRLNRARQAAVAERGKRRRTGWWLPTAGVACSVALLLAVAVWPSRGARDLTAPAHAVAAVGADADTAAEDSIEFYQNLEF